MPPDHDEPVTVPVTRPPPTMWETVGLTEEQWNDLEIPDFLRRVETPAYAYDANTVRASAAKSSPGKTSGSRSQPPSVPSGAQQPASRPPKDRFAAYRVDPEDIESKIRQEADRRYREWMPPKNARTKRDLQRPRMAAFLKQVRKEYYPS